MTISGVGNIGICIHIGYNFIKVEYSRPDRFVIFIANDRSFWIIKQYGTEEITGLSLKILCKSINSEWNFGKMSLMVDLRLDIRSEEMFT